MEGAEEVRMGVAREDESEEAFFVTVAAALSHLVRIYSLRVVRLVAVLVDQPSRPLAMHHLKWALIPSRVTSRAYREQACYDYHNEEREEERS
jgi:hypothetical protein